MEPTVRELTALRHSLDSLTSGSMAILQNSVDVTQREIADSSRTLNTLKVSSRIIRRRPWHGLLDSNLVRIEQADMA